MGHVLGAGVSLAVDVLRVQLEVKLHEVELVVEDGEHEGGEHNGGTEVMPQASLPMMSLSYAYLVCTMQSSKVKPMVRDLGGTEQGRRVTRVLYAPMCSAHC